MCRQYNIYKYSFDKRVIFHPLISSSTCIFKSHQTKPDYYGHFCFRIGFNDYFFVRFVHSFTWFLCHFFSPFHHCCWCGGGGGGGGGVQFSFRFCWYISPFCLHSNAFLFGIFSSLLSSIWFCFIFFRIFFAVFHFCINLNWMRAYDFGPLFKLYAQSLYVCSVYLFHISIFEACVWVPLSNICLQTKLYIFFLLFFFFSLGFLLSSLFHLSLSLSFSILFNTALDKAYIRTNQTIFEIKQTKKVIYYVISCVPIK